MTISEKQREGFTTWEADSLPITAPVGLEERLSWEQPLALRANAPGTLTTISIRGAGPNRTPVLWNGLNLQSPQNGVTDIALIPFWPGDDLSIVAGGQSATWGSGAMGGILEINSRAGARQGWSGQTGGTAGSFGMARAHGQLGWGSQRWSSDLRGSIHYAENDFPFINTTQIGQPEQRQVNNRVQKADIQQHNQWWIDEKQVINTAFWYQKADRQIPPSMTAARTDTWQKDENLRVAVTYRSSDKWMHRAAWSDEQIHFFINGSTDTSRARTGLWVSRFQTKENEKWQFFAECQLMPQWGTADGYADSSRWYAQFRGAVSGGARRKWTGGTARLRLRQEWTDFTDVPLLWTLALEQAIWKEVSAHAHVSRSFNLPTLNDRFWFNLGKEDLQPEDGYSSEVGLRWAPALGNQKLELNATGFYLLVDDWILWQPDPDGIFRPGNLRQVVSKGLEASASYERNLGALNLQLKVNYQYADVSHSKVYGGNTEVLDKQLIYTPMHLAGGHFRMRYNNFAFAYLHQFSGARFTVSDESASLPAFQTGNVLMRYIWPLSEMQLHIEGRLGNCWDAPYQVLAFRPMPGRNWQLGLNLVF